MQFVHSVSKLIAVPAHPGKISVRNENFGEQPYPDHLFLPWGLPWLPPSRVTHNALLATYVLETIMLGNIQ